MSIYIVAIKWNTERVEETTTLESLLDANFKWVKLTEDLYLIVSSNSPIEIRNFITSKLANLSRIFIGEMKESAAWRNMLADNDKIKQIFSNE